MDPSRWIILLRWPLEIVSFGLAFAPLLSMRLAWASLPAQIPAHFGITGRPDRRGSRERAWMLPILALIIYAFMSQASGTWAWALHGTAELPAGAELPLILKPVIALLVLCANQMLIRVARTRTEALNGCLLSGLMLLLLAPPFAVSFAAL